MRSWERASRPPCLVRGGASRPRVVLARHLAPGPGGPVQPPRVPATSARRRAASATRTRGDASAHPEQPPERGVTTYLLPTFISRGSGRLRVAASGDGAYRVAPRLTDAWTSCAGGPCAEGHVCSPYASPLSVAHGHVKAPAASETVSGRHWRCFALDRGWDAHESPLRFRLAGAGARPISHSCAEWAGCATHHRRGRRVGSRLRGPWRRPG